jgi:hypothetical protein
MKRSEITLNRAEDGPTFRNRGVRVGRRYTRNKHDRRLYAEGVVRMGERSLKPDVPQSA